MDFLIALIIGLAAGAIALGILFGQLKTVVKQHAAADYVDPGSLKLTERKDLYLYQHTEHTPIQRQAPPQQK